jgi:Ca2+/H+ antiporter
LSHWYGWIPFVAGAVLAVAWGQSLANVAVLVVAVSLVGAVLTAVHHAEVVAHRVGEPFGTLILALAVTVIEAALVVSMILSGGDGAAAIVIPGVAGNPEGWRCSGCCLLDPRLRRGRRQKTPSKIKQRLLR